MFFSFSSGRDVCNFGRRNDESLSQLADCQKLLQQLFRLSDVHFTANFLPELSPSRTNDDSVVDISVMTFFESSRKRSAAFGL